MALLPCSRLEKSILAGLLDTELDDVVAELLVIVFFISVHHSAGMRHITAADEQHGAHRGWHDISWSLWSLGGSRARHKYNTWHIIVSSELKSLCSYLRFLICSSTTHKLWAGSEQWDGEYALKSEHAKRGEQASSNLHFRFLHSKWWHHRCSSSAVFYFTVQNIRHATNYVLFLPLTLWDVQTSFHPFFM